VEKYRMLKLTHHGALRLPVRGSIIQIRRARGAARKYALVGYFRNGGEKFP
jgi:hypothetical protein